MEVFKLLAGAKAPNMSPGLSLLLSLVQPSKGAITGSPDKGQPGDPTVGGSPQAIRRECEHAWECMQSECQALLAEVLAAPSLQARPDAGVCSAKQVTSQGSVIIEQAGDQGDLAGAPTHFIQRPFVWPWGSWTSVVLRRPCKR